MILIDLTAQKALILGFNQLKTPPYSITNSKRTKEKVINCFGLSYVLLQHVNKLIPKVQKVPNYFYSIDLKPLLFRLIINSYLDSF